MIRRLLARRVPRRTTSKETVTDLPACPVDPDPRQLAELQGLCSLWSVMWCWYRREYMAIAKFDTVDPILFDPNPRRLVYRCRAAELAVNVSDRFTAGATPIPVRPPTPRSRTGWPPGRAR